MMLEVIHSNPELKVKCWKQGCQGEMLATSLYDNEYSIEINLCCEQCKATATLKLDIDTCNYSKRTW